MTISLNSSAIPHFLKIETVLGQTDIPAPAIGVKSGDFSNMWISMEVPFGRDLELDLSAAARERPPMPAPLFD